MRFSVAITCVGGDQPGAFELPRRAGVARAPQEVLVVEAVPHVVPAAVAGVPVDHPVRRGEFVGRVGEAADQHHRHAGRPGQPGQPAAEADERLGMPQPARPLGQRPVAGLVLRAVRDVVPHQARAVHRLLVDADHPVAAGLEEARPPRASRAGCSSILHLRRALHGDADIGFGDRPAVVGQRRGAAASSAGSTPRM